MGIEVFYDRLHGERISEYLSVDKEGRYSLNIPEINLDFSNFTRKLTPLEIERVVKSIDKTIGELFTGNKPKPCYDLIPTASITMGGIGNDVFALFGLEHLIDAFCDAEYLLLDTESAEDVKNAIVDTMSEIRLSHGIDKYSTVLEKMRKNIAGYKFSRKIEEEIIANM